MKFNFDSSLTCYNLEQKSIKRSRATVKLEEFEQYFDNLEKTITGVLPEDILNYDETNATDDPGEEKVVVRKSTKHAERVLDSSKSSTSLMFCGSAAGFLLPVYVVYKATNMYDSWTEGGPPNTVYNRTKSGWFDMETFEDWYFKVPLKYFKTRPSENKKVLIGDNCASHLSAKVIQSCLDNNISFVFLPKNSTHLSQPLDIAWFKSFKAIWRQKLSKWKEKNNGVLPKSKFPQMLDATLKELGTKSSQNLKSGFKASGIYPLERNQLLKRLPQYKNREILQNETVSFDGMLVRKLNETRYKTQNEKKKNNLLRIKPGESVTNEETIAIIEAKNKERTQKSKSKQKQSLEIHEPKVEIVEFEEPWNLDENLNESLERVGSASTQNPEKRCMKKTGNLADQEGSKRGGLKRTRASVRSTMKKANVGNKQVISRCFHFPDDFSHKKIIYLPENP